MSDGNGGPNRSGDSPPVGTPDTDSCATDGSEAPQVSDDATEQRRPPRPARGDEGSPPVTTLHEPAHREALWALETAFERGELVTIFGRCTVEYDGRAASNLGPGRRLLVLKPDGAALVHTDEGRTPVNWQPPGSQHHATIRDGRLRVRSQRSDPTETLDVVFDRISHLSALSVTGGRTVAVAGSEVDLRQRILDTPSLIEPGFDPQSTEHPTDAGPVDIFGIDAEARPVAVELKRRRVGPDAVGQLTRYVRALERDSPDRADVRGILVAPSITDRAAKLLDTEGLEHVSLQPDPDEASESPERDHPT